MEEIIKLAAMECAASSILVYLQHHNLSHRHFLLDYWHLSYMADILVSGRHIRFWELDKLYGIRMEPVRSGEEELRGRLTEGQNLLLYCRPSALPFFPRENLTHEGLGFEHMLLVQGYEADGDAYAVTDSVVDYQGTVAADDLRASAAKEGDWRYFALTPPSADFVPPTSEEMFRHATGRNLAFYDNEKQTSSGGKALDLFARTLVVTQSWGTEERNLWIDRNNVTISSIIKTRTKIWESFLGLGVLGPEAAAELEREIQGIVKLWTLLNFLLIKYKRKPQEDALIASMRQKVVEIKRTELRFLQRIHELGGARCEV